MLTALLLATASVFNTSPLELRCTGSKVVVDLSDSASPDVRFELVNRSDSSVQVWSAGFWNNHRLELFDAHGEAVPLTPEGEKKARLFGSRRRDHAVPYVLVPGASRQYRCPPLTDFFDVQPGIYYLFVTYQDRSYGKMFRVLSRPIVLQVVE